MKLKWKKLGQVLNVNDIKLPLGCAEFAQSPQALVFDDFVRIYFSTRQRDSDGRHFLSHVAYVDMNLDLSSIIKVSQESVLELGKLGTFDEHGIFPFSAFRDGNKITAFTCGWSRRVSVSVETATGYVESFDNGETYKRQNDGPIFSASLHEPFLVGDSFVRKYNDIYHMWYMYGTRWVKENDLSSPDRVYKIGHAISENLVDWQRDGKAIIPDRLHENECQALPTVIQLNNVYHMFFCYRDVFGFRTDSKKSYRLGYAWSKDLINWTRDDIGGGMTVFDTSWDSEMQCYPHIFEMNGRIYLLYNGNQFGRYGFGAAVLESIEE